MRAETRALLCHRMGVKFARILCELWRERDPDSEKESLVGEGDRESSPDGLDSKRTPGFEVSGSFRREEDVGRKRAWW